MARESLTTFSTGQPLASDATTAAAADSPIYEFKPESGLGADQVLQFLTTTTSRLSFSAETTGSSVPVEPKIPPPSGATFPPPLRHSIAGRVPRLKTRQLWEGTVTKIGEEGFAAILNDKTNPRNPDEQVMFEFDRTEISPEDLPLISPGSSFYWIIGNEQTAGGQVKNVSMLQFRRVPAWSERSLARVADRARQVKALFRNEA